MHRECDGQARTRRDQRPDCKQVCIALVVTREGLPLSYEVFVKLTSGPEAKETFVLCRSEALVPKRAPSMIAFANGSNRDWPVSNAAC